MDDYIKTPTFAHLETPRGYHQQQALTAYKFQTTRSTIFSLATTLGMPSDGSAVMPVDTWLTVSVKDRYQITVKAFGIDMEPVVALEEGTYSIPLRSSSSCRDHRKALTHPGPEHPKISGTLPSDRRTKTLGEIKLQITTNVASMITFVAFPALCLELNPVRCEYYSMVHGTIEVCLKPIRRNDYLCGRDLLPSSHHRFPHHSDIIKDRVQWTFTTTGPERKEWRASESQCPNVSLPDLEVDVSGAGTYEFDVGNVLPDRFTAEDPMPDEIPESPFGQPGSTVCNSLTASRESSCGKCDSSSNGSNSAGDEIVLIESPSPVPEELAGVVIQSDVEPLRSGMRSKRGNGGFVEGAESFANKKARR